MNYRRWLAVAAILAAVGAVVAVTPDPLVAQIRAAFVKNVDETYRQPYEVYSEFWAVASSSDQCTLNCANWSQGWNSFLFDLPPVPAGKRLVIKHVSGRLGTTDTTVHVVFQDSQVLMPQLVRWSYFGPFYPAAAGGMIGFNAEASFTYGPGERPHVNLLLPGHNNSLSYIMVSGYLIDATN